MPFLTGEAGKEKTEVYRLFWKGKKSRTAAQIYDMLREGEFGKSCTDAWRSLFFMDGHSLWRMLSKGELAGIRDVWERQRHIPAGMREMPVRGQEVKRE